MRPLLSLTLAFGLVVGLAACDTAESDQATADAKKSNDGFIVHTFDANGNASERRQDKVAVCHYDDETATYKRISVGAPALSAHLRHGDGVPNGEVPEAEVPSTFGDDCDVVPDVPFTCEAVYDVDALGRPRLTATATANDPSTTAGGGGGQLSEGPDGAYQSTFDFGSLSWSDNPASTTFGAIATATPNDDLFTLISIVRFPDGTSEVYNCGPFPVVLPNPS